MKLILKIFVVFLFNSLSLNAQINYTLSDDDVAKIKNGCIIELTKKGQDTTRNIRNTTIVIPETIKGQTVIGLGHGHREGNTVKGLFDSVLVNGNKIKLPNTLKYIGNHCFFNLEYAIDFQTVKNIEELGSMSFFGGAFDKVNYMPKLDFSNLSKLKRIKYLSIAYIYAMDTIDFSNCKNLQILEPQAVTMGFVPARKIIFDGCVSLREINWYCFSYVDFKNRPNLLEEPDLSDCKSLVFIGRGVFGLGLQSASGKTQNIPTFETYKLPTPKIKGLTFVSWYTGKGERVGNIAKPGATTHYIAKFKECVISSKFVGGYLASKIYLPYDEIIKSISKAKKEEANKNQIIFEIRNHSIQQVNISAIKTTNGGTLSWQKGTIKTGETQKVVVTYPEGTTDYTNTISIEGPGLKGNTTVKISKTGETTTDNNMLSSVAQEQLAREQNKLLSVYPNPAVSELHISYSKPEASYSVKIVSLQGKTMYQNNRFEGTAVDISHLPPAVYLIQVNESVQTFIKH